MITYESLMENPQMKQDFLALSPEEQGEVFGTMAPPSDGVDYAPEDLRQIQQHITGRSGEPSPTVEQPTEPSPTVEQPDSQPVEQQEKPGYLQRLAEPYINNPHLAEPTDRGPIQALSEAGDNFAPSTFHMARDLYEVAKHPVDSARGLWTLAKGIVSKAIPGEQASEKAVDALVEHYKGEYGGDNWGEIYQNILHKIATDPAGLVSDAAIVATGGAAVVAKVAKGSKIASTATKVAKGLNKIDVAQAPLKVIGKGVKAVGSKALDKVAPTSRTVEWNDRIKKHLKFSDDGGLPSSDAMAESFIARGLNLTRKAVKGLGDKMNKIQTVIDRAIDRATRAGKTIKTTVISKAFDDLIDDMAKYNLEGADAPKYLKQLQVMRDDWVKFKGESMTPRQVQDLKVSLGSKFKKHLGEEFGHLKDKVDDALRTTSMEVLNDMFKKRWSGKPGSVGREGLKGLNKEWGKNKDLKKLIEKRVDEIASETGFMKSGLAQGALSKGLTSAFGIGARAGVMTGQL